MPTANLPQGITNPLNAGFQAATCLALDAYNTVNGVSSIALPDSRSAFEPTAEWRNTVNAAVRAFADYVQGLTPITALQISAFLRLPTYATGSLPAASVPNEGRVYFDTTTNRIVYDNGGALQSVATTTDVAGAGFSMRVQAEGGAIDVSDPELLEFDETDFAIAGDSSGLTIALGEVGLNHLPTASAQSVLGRSAGTTGVRADIAGTGTTEAPTILTSAGTVAFRSTATLGEALGVLLEEDLSALSTNAFADGVEVIGTLGNVTVANTANAGATWGIVNGTGLRMSVASATRSMDTSETPDAPYFYFPASQLPGFRSGRPFYIDIRIAASTFANGNDRTQLGVWGPANEPVTGAADRFRYGVRGNNGGTDTIGIGADASRTFFGATTQPSALSVKIDPNGPVMVGYGTYSGGWPAFDYVAANNTLAGTGSNQFTYRAIRVFFAQCTGAGAAGSIDISRWRFRQ